MTQGGRFAGAGLDVEDRRRVFHNNNCGVEHHVVASKGKLAPGNRVITLDFNYGAAARARSSRLWRNRMKIAFTAANRGIARNGSPKLS